MSWSLLLQNGDLAIDGSGLAQVTGSQKLYQDLSCAVLTPMGTDDLAPDYGSTLDGGTKSDGTVVPSPIGRLDKFVQLEVTAEVNRIIQDYQARQLARAKADKMTYGKTTLTLGEIIADITPPQLNQFVDHLQVLVQISTMAGTNLQLNVPITGE